MSSFRRKPRDGGPGPLQAPPRPTRGGTKPFVNGQTLVSSGLSQLDAFLGGGLLLGSLALVEAPGSGSSTSFGSSGGASRALVDDLHRYFVAEGVAAGHGCVLVAEDAAAFVAQQLPLELSLAQALVKQQQQQQQQQANNQQRLTIAWQYGKYDGAQPAGSGARFCHSFDLSRPMQRELLAGGRAPVAVDTLDAAFSSSREPKGAYAALFGRVQAAVDAADPGAVVRVCVRELGSPLLGPPTASHMAAALLFVRKLRSLAAGNGEVGRARVVCQLSGPALAGAFPAAFLNELRHASDYALQLRAFAGARDLLPPELGEFHGLLELRKLARVHALAPFAAPATRLGVKRDHRKLRVEKFHLVPEASRSSSSSSKSRPTPAGDPLAF